jgi:hypothetical protein
MLIIYSYSSTYPFQRDETETVIHADDAFATVAFLRVLKWHLEDKPSTEPLKFLLPQNESAPKSTIQTTSAASSPSTFSWSDGSLEEVTKSGVSIVTNKVRDFVYLSGISRQRDVGADQQLGELLTKVKGTMHSFLISQNLLIFD